MYRKTVTIKNKKGIHARPSAIIVSNCNKYKSKIELRNENKGIIANGNSVLSIMQLIAEKDTDLTVVAEGPDEKEAVETIAKIIEDFSISDNTDKIPLNTQG